MIQIKYFTIYQWYFYQYKSVMIIAEHHTTRTQIHFCKAMLSKTYTMKDKRNTNVIKTHRHKGE